MADHHTDDLMYTLLIAAFGKALIKKGILTSEDIAEQLDKFDLSDPKTPPELHETIEKLKSAVSRW